MNTAMNTHDEHDDDIEPEVVEDEEIETERYEPEEDIDEGPLDGDMTGRRSHSPENRTRTGADDEEEEGEGSDSI
jgi:hypothetical protein